MSDNAYKKIREAMDPARIKQICEMHEEVVGFEYGMHRVEVNQRIPDDYYWFQDNGADVLFVAHLDTVVDHEHRTTRVVDTTAGLVVHSGALDDRLGAYVGLELLPALGVKHDILFTVGEEVGRSTAQFFEPSKEYNWMIEFDRAGTDVVMYQYDDKETRALVKDSGARVGEGSFSDIAYLEHLEIKGFNWGVGYDGDYHSVRGFAYLDDTAYMVERYLKFHGKYAGVYLPHEYNPRGSWWGSGYGSRTDWEYASLRVGHDEIARNERTEGLVFADGHDIDPYDGYCWDCQNFGCADAIGEQERAHGDDEYAAHLELTAKVEATYSEE